MSGARGWLLYAVLLAAAFAIALAARTDAQLDSPTPSVENPGPRGIRAVFLYLEEMGLGPRALHAPLTDIPDDVATVVLAEPVGTPVTTEEVAALRDFAQAGGTVVVMGRALAARQPALAEWLQAEDAIVLGSPSEPSQRFDDPDGVTAEVWLQHGPFESAERLRLENREGLMLRHPGALPAAGTASAPAVWWVPEGRGEVLVFAGTDVLENRRIELEDNLLVWDALARRGPMAFDEFHHQVAPPPPMSRGVWALALQLLVVFALFALARGIRLGPPRPELAERHRSRLEYLNAFAWLTRRAGVEKALLAEAHTRFRILLHDRLGVPVSLDEQEVARELERHCRIPSDEWLELVARLQRLQTRDRVTPAEFARAARTLAQLERVVTGQDDPTGNR